MAEVSEEVVFHTKADQVQFNTRTNGDKFTVNNLQFSQNQATSFSWLVNADGQVELEWQVKIKGT